MGFQFTVFLSLIRSLFPRWNFFDQIAFAFEVNYKMSSDTEWKQLNFDLKHKSSRIMFNPFVNETLLNMGIIDQFARDVQELQNENPKFSYGDIKKLTTYQLLCSLVSVKLKYANHLTDDRYKFKIIAKGLKEDIEIFESETIQLGKV